jgi:hypothetical protein
MLLTEKVIVFITYRNFKYFYEKGYNVEKNEPLEVSIKDIKYGSHIEVDIQCDKCKVEKRYLYQAYNRYTKNQTIPYYCNKCNVDRIKQSFENKYGEGITNSMHLEEYRIKQRDNLKISLTKEVLEKRKNTCQEKYGVNVPCKNDEIKDKLKNTINSKSLLEKEEIKQKRENTSLERYGVYNVNQIEEVLIKSKNTRIKKGNQIPDDKLSSFKLYRKKVTSLTNKNKRELFNLWDGKDFYDNEYIKDNLNLNKYSRLYPTIDHKTSVFYGFINNIQPEEISKMENLCITKRTNNSKKSSNNFLLIE